MMRAALTRRLERRAVFESTAVELAARSNDGFDVSLFWDRRSGEVWVDVLHMPTGEGFRMLPPAARALDAYYHPFAYA
jgi:hypothetical protein